MSPRTGVLAVIPARGGSKGLPGKNIKSFAGLPLIAHTILFSKMCPEIDRCVVSTDSRRIADIAAGYGADVPCIRPSALAEDDTPLWLALRHVFLQVEKSDGIQYDYLLLLDPTSPARDPSDVSRAFRRLRETPRADGIIGVSRPHFNPLWVCVTESDGWMTDIHKYGSQFQSRQKVPPVYRINGYLYIWRAEFVRKEKKNWRRAGKYLMYEIPELRAMSIDSAEEFDVAEMLVTGGKIKFPWRRRRISPPSPSESMIPLSPPLLQGNEWKYLKECLDTGWVSSAGPFVEKFEKSVADRVGVPHAVAAVNGTSALHVALRVCGVQTDDEVIVSNLTFVAPVNAVRYCEAHPVLMDAHPDTWQMDVEKVARFLDERCVLKDGRCYNTRTSRRVSAILPVHILGSACKIDYLVELAKRYHLKIVEDACEGMGVLYARRHVGTFGDIGVFSFNGNKIVTAGGGGMLVTHDARYAEYARYLTTQAKDDEIEYIHNEIGYNYRLTNLQAAVGLAQMEQLDEFLNRKQALARMYDEAIQEFGALLPMPCPADVRQTYWLYTALLPEGVSLPVRQEIVRRLNETGVGCRPLWHPIHALPLYRNSQSYRIEHSMDLYTRAISLPSGVGMTEADMERCMDALKQIVQSCTNSV